MECCRSFHEENSHYCCYKMTPRQVLPWGNYCLFKRFLMDWPPLSLQNLRTWWEQVLVTNSINPPLPSPQAQYRDSIPSCSLTLLNVWNRNGSLNVQAFVYNQPPLAIHYVNWLSRFVVQIFIFKQTFFMSGFRNFINILSLACHQSTVVMQH